MRSDDFYQIDSCDDPRRDELDGAAQGVANHSAASSAAAPSVAADRHVDRHVANVELCSIVVDPIGAVRFIFRDELVDLLAAGQSNITRASHVEPTEDSQWEADLSPVAGPRLGPFRTRGEALAAEVAWLQGHGF